MGLRTIPGIEIFQGGTQKGTPWTTEDLVDMVRNSVLLGKRHVAPIGIGHDENQPDSPSAFGESGEPAFGQVPKLSLQYRLIDGESEPVPTLVGDGEGVPEYIAGLVNHGAYRNVSAEIYPDPPEWAKAVPGVKGPVLKRVSLLGKDLPGVKNLADVTEIFRRAAPDARLAFSERTPMRLRYTRHAATAAGTVLCFSEATPMSVPVKKKWLDRMKDAFKRVVAKFDDGMAGGTPTWTRDDLLAAYGAAGGDVTLITDAIPDNVLADMLRVVQMTNEQTATEQVEPMSAECQPKTVNSEPPASGGDATATSQPATPPSDQAKKDAAMNHAEAVKFAERLKAIETDTEKANAAAQSALKFAEEQKAAAKKTLIYSEVDAACLAGRLTPAERNGQINLLLNADATAVVKFGEESMTQLDYGLKLLRERPNVVEFGERLKTPKNANGTDAEEARVLRYAEDHKDDLAKMGVKASDIVTGFKVARDRRPGLTASDYLKTNAA